MYTDQVMENLQLLIPGISTQSSRSFFDKLLGLLDVSDKVPGWTDSFGVALRSLVQQQLETPIRTLSLFSGGGGLDIAFHDAGFDIVQMIEVDSRYVETLMANSAQGGRLFGARPICIDIKNFNPTEDLQIDFVIGGPPCQTFSAAGRRAAGVPGLDDPRGSLFEEYIKILQILKPRGFLFENVYGVVGAQNGKPWELILEAFRAVGYKVSYRILDTADYGVPQNRERLIVVGTQDRDFLFPRPTHGLDSPDLRPFYTAGNSVLGIEDSKPKQVGGRYGHLLKDIPPGLNYSFYTEKLGHPTPVFAWRSKFSDFLYKADPEMPVRTIKAQGGQYTGPFHWENRPFSIGELKRLQTFPIDYVITGGRQVAIEQIGNSVPPQFGRILGIAVLNQIFNLKFPFEMDYLSHNEELGFRKRKRLLNKVYEEKAKKAILELYSSEHSSNLIQQVGTGLTTQRNLEKTNFAFAAYLDENFSWSVKGDTQQEYPWNVKGEIKRDDETLDVFVLEQNAFSTEPALVVKILPSKKWVIPQKKVNLYIHSLSQNLFTAAWKAFEYYINREGIKADLVQLNGYYQYQPNLVAKVLKLEGDCSNEEFHKWQVIKKVTEGEGVRQIIALDDLSRLWKLPRRATVSSLIQLRSFGYEVRSEYTNNQIPTDCILIPYSFPTLNPRSVQLRKILFSQEIIQSVSSCSKQN